MKEGLHVCSGPSRATAGPGETFFRAPKYFYGAPLGKKFLNFSFQNGTFWRTLYFWPMVGPRKHRGARRSLPPHSTLSTGLCVFPENLTLSSKAVCLFQTSSH